MRLRVNISDIKNNMPALIDRYLLIAILIGLMIFFGVLNPVFLSIENIFNIGRQVSIFGIMAAGMTIVLVCGHIDLSVGSIVALSGVVTAMIAQAGLGIVPAFLGGTLVGGVAGFLNGYLTAKFSISSLLVTLGSMSAIRGFAYVITGGRPVWGLPPSFGAIGGGYLWVIPIPVVILILVFLIAWVIMNRTTVGRNFFAVGGNPEAAILSGINIKNVTLGALCMSGIAAGLSGAIWASRLTSGQPLVGQGYELQVIAAAVIGGASLKGGQADILKSLVGAFILGVLYNGLNLLRVSPYWQMVGTGAIIIIAVIIDSVRQQK